MMIIPSEYNCYTFAGFQYGVENLKSIILMLGITDKLLTVEKAVQLARLETVYQVILNHLFGAIHSNFFMFG